jgi:tRNA (guanine-N7-)-methyltransferase
MDWSSYYPAFVLDNYEEAINPEPGNEVDNGLAVKKLKQDIDVADIGCGFGGLLVALAPIMPDTLLLGLYI